MDYKNHNSAKKKKKKKLRMLYRLQNGGQVTDFFFRVILIWAKI